MPSTSDSSSEANPPTAITDPFDPWPHDSLRSNGATFDPNRPRHRGVPLVRVRADRTVELVRGSIDSPGVADALAGEQISDETPAGTVYGVFGHPDDVFDDYLVSIGEYMPLDVRYMRLIELTNHFGAYDNLDALEAGACEVLDWLRSLQARGFRPHHRVELHQPDGVVRRHLRAAARPRSLRG